jgi:hypothetical protein
MAARARVFLGCMIATPPAVYVHLFVTKPLFTTSYRNNCIPTVHSSASLEKSHTFAVAVADSAPCSSYYNMHIPPTDDPATAATTTWKAIQHIRDEHTWRMRKEPLMNGSSSDAHQSDTRTQNGTSSFLLVAMSCAVVMMLFHLFCRFLPRLSPIPSNPLSLL